MSRWKAVLIVIVAAPAVHYLATISAQHAAKSHDTRPISVQSSSTSDDEVRVRVDIRSSNGITQDDMDTEFLGNFERAMAAEMKQTVQRSLEQAGHSAEDIDISSEAFYTYADSIKLLVLRIQLSGVHQTMVTGIIGDEQRVITCVAPSRDTIPITYGKCGERIKEVFGAEIGV